MNNPCYQASGRVPVTLLPLSLLALLAILPCAWVYAWALGSIPIVIGVLLAFAYSACMALIVRTLATCAKVRNPGWMGKTGILLALAG